MPTKVCGFWDCNVGIRGNYVVCKDHYPDYADGLLDTCPSCGQFKSVEYDVCKNCYGAPSKRTRTAKSKKAAPKVKESACAYAPGAPDAGPQRDDETAVFYVYILDRDDNTYYVGQTNHLKARLVEHRKAARAGSELTSDLVWFALQYTREEAVDYETYLTKLVHTNRRAITRLIADFNSLVDELQVDE